MQEDGVIFLFETSPSKFALEGDKISATFVSKDGVEKKKVFDTVLIATGRRPNVESLGCETAGVEFDSSGVMVNEHLQTKNENIYAVGDCLPGHKFTHNSDIHARYVVRNALLNWKEDQTKIILPYTTYTDPEISSVGLNETQLKAAGIEYETYTKFFDRLDRAVCEGKRDGIYKVNCKKGTD
jgi:pyruvate/2-oxoglutarate dehydrogenase complex dihydrolipoamide dehydrogenase (E3) component